jgi:hypothetical protein
LSSHRPARAQGLTLFHSAAWLLPALLDGGAAALPALASLELGADEALPVVQRLFEERSLLARLTLLKVNDGGSLSAPLPGPPDPVRCSGGMRMEDLEVSWGVAMPAVDAAALAAWPMPRLRRLAISEVDPARLRTLLRARWAAGLADLRLAARCLRTAKGALGGGSPVTCKGAWQRDHACQRGLACALNPLPCL